MIWLSQINKYFLKNQASALSSRRVTIPFKSGRGVHVWERMQELKILKFKKKKTTTKNIDYVTYIMLKKEVKKLNFLSNPHLFVK